MANASIRPQRFRPSRRATLPTLAEVVSMVMRGGSAVRAGSSWTPGSPVRPASSRAFTEPPAEGPVGQARARAAFQLLNTYAASALDLERRTQGVDLSSTLHLGPVAVRALVDDVVQSVEPLAKKADLALLRDVHAGWDGVCCADPELLRAVVTHLVLRALSMEQASGHARVMVTLTQHEAHILILSRRPEVTLAGHPDAARHDLVAPQRLLQAMGGSLVLEPRRAGYLPLCIALPALAAAAAASASRRAA